MAAPRLCRSILNKLSRNRHGCLAPLQVVFSAQVLGSHRHHGRRVGQAQVEKSRQVGRQVLMVRLAVLSVTGSL